MRTSLLRGQLLALLSLVGCSASPATSDTVGRVSIRSGTDSALHIGFNGPETNTTQLVASDAFYQASAIDSSPRLCHTYVPWNVALRAETIPTGGGSAAEGACYSPTLGRTVPDNACVQTDPASCIPSQAGTCPWQQCSEGKWIAQYKQVAACSETYPLGAGGGSSGGAAECQSTTLGRAVADNACVQGDDGKWYQCSNGTWTSRWSDATACNGAYPSTSTVTEGGAGSPVRLGALKAWMSAASEHCDEALISFQAETEGAPPSAADYAAAFKAFLETDWGFRGTLAFTPWNEPNNPGGAGNGTGVIIDADLAAQYYIEARTQCGSKCKIAAGDFASNGGLWRDFDGTVPSSYLARYKAYLDAHMPTQPGLPSHPEYFAYHAWHDANQYTFGGTKCTGSNCVTNLLVSALDAAWSGVEIWDTEVGAGQVGVGDNHLLSEKQQACGVSYLLEMTEAEPRIKRLYYTRLQGNGGGQELFIPSATSSQAMATPALRVLASRNLVSSDECDPVAGQFENPVIAMFDRPDGVPQDVPADYPGHATEGCPDPSILRADDGDFYMYCTSYTWPGDGQRTNGFPIFKSPKVGGPWTRAKDAAGHGASILAPKFLSNGTSTREYWPTWIEGAGGWQSGELWAPDVHALPAGAPWKYVAEYAAPCKQDAHVSRDNMCIGVAYADKPEGPWTSHKGADGTTDEPFVYSTDAGGVSPGGMFYDPSLLITHDDHYYLYWVAVGSGAPGGRGVLGAEVQWKGKQLELVSNSAGSPIAPTAIEQKCQEAECKNGRYVGDDGPGEGPYVIEHQERDGTYLYYEFYSTGTLVYDYHVGVRVSTKPIGQLFQDGPTKACTVDGKPGLCGTNRILQHNGSFVATGGNSVVQDVGGVDFLAYHAIVVPSGGGCTASERVDPETGKKIDWSASNPHCREPGQRQAMVDAIAWVTLEGSSVEWPALRNGTGSPSAGQAASIWP